MLLLEADIGEYQVVVLSDVKGEKSRVDFHINARL